MKRVALIVLLIAVVVVPATALARRKANSQQRKGIIAAGVAAKDISKAQGPCARIYVSTVNSNWASLDFPPQPSHACRQLVANGVGLFQKRSGKWHFVTAGSEFTCPIKGVPKKVAHDLKVC